jgi:hypothetical protein
MTEQRPGLAMCVCTGKCPGFSKKFLQKKQIRGLQKERALL